MKWPCGMSLGKRARSTSSTSRPLRASSIAVAAPAHRAPMTIASYIVFATLTHDGSHVTRRSPRIAAIGSPVLRNLEITLRLLAARGGRRGAQRAGRELVHVRHLGLAAGGRDDPRRGHDRPPADRLLAAARCCTRCASFGRWLLRRGLFDRGSRLGRLMGRLHTPFDAVELASDAVARGNRKVFEEIGYEFARYLEADDLDAFLAGLRDGDPPDGQALLRAAFTRYAGASPARRQLLLREPRDRPARADPPAARDPRGDGRRLHDQGGPRPAAVPGAAPAHPARRRDRRRARPARARRSSRAS